MEQKYQIHNLDDSIAIIGNYLLGDAIERIRSTVALTCALLIPQSGMWPQYLVTDVRLYELQMVTRPISKTRIDKDELVGHLRRSIRGGEHG